MCPERRISLRLSKGRYTSSQGATTKRVTDGYKGPIGEATFFSYFRNLLGYERQMRRKPVSGVSDGIGEIVGQKVDNIAAVIQPFVYVRWTCVSRYQLTWKGCSQSAPRFCLFINAESPWFTASQDQISSIIGSSSPLFDSICRRAGSQHYHERMNKET